MKKSAKIIIAVIVAALVMGGAAAGVVLYTRQQEAKEEAKKANPDTAEEGYGQMREDLVLETEDPYESEIDFEALQEQNADAYAWIRIPGTAVDYPILQSATEADDYYLNTTIDGKKGYPGSIYTEKYNSTAFTDPVTVVYGHDMLEGTMFTDLHKYEDRAFFDSNPYLYIYLPDRTLKYQIFAAVPFDDRYLLGSYNFAEAEDFQAYLDELRNSLEGNVNPDVEVTQENSILTLSTCIADSPEQRWLVNATLIEQKE